MQKITVLQIMTDIRNLLSLHKDILTLDEAVTYTGFEKSYMYKLCSQKKIPHYKTPAGKTTFFDRTELSNWLKSNRIKPHYELDEEAKNFIKSKIYK